MDRRALGTGDLIEPPPPTESTQAPIRSEDDMDEATGSSAKIDQLIHLLRLTPGNEKSLVFSQFTTFLDKVGPLLWLCQITDATPCLEKIAEVLDKEGSIHLHRLLFLTHVQCTFIGYHTSDLTAGCPQRGDKKHWRHFLYQSSMTRRKPRTLNPFQMFRRRSCNRRDAAHGPHAEEKRAVECINKQM